MRILNLLIILSIALIFVCKVNSQSSNNAELQLSNSSYDQVQNNRPENVFGNSPDGNLIVSDFNNRVTYQYPISSFKKKNAQISVNLNYCDGINFHSFAVAAPVNSSETETSWISRPHKKAAWVLGINGFAVQVLSGTGFFINNPAYQDLNYPYYPPSMDTGTRLFPFNNLMNWAIEGYDFCNDLFGNVSDSDEISLLRSDGSVLKLQNTVPWTSPINSSGGRGLYIDETANASGYALVSYLNYSPSRRDSINDAYIDGKGYREEENSPTNFTPQFFTTEYYRPREVRYFPGDGFEYVFHEYTTPYGLDFAMPSNQYIPIPSSQIINNYFQDQNSNFSFVRLGQIGYKSRSPRIFYLVEIRHGEEKVLDLLYDRHVTRAGERTLYTDLSFGRANLTHIEHHNFDFSPSGAKIEAFDKEIELDFGKNRVHDNSFYTFDYTSIYGGGAFNNNNNPSWGLYKAPDVIPLDQQFEEMTEDDLRFYNNEKTDSEKKLTPFVSGSVLNGIYNCFQQTYYNSTKFNKSVQNPNYNPFFESYEMDDAQDISLDNNIELTNHFTGNYHSYINYIKTIRVKESDNSSLTNKEKKINFKYENYLTVWENKNLNSFPILVDLNNKITNSTQNTHIIPFTFQIDKRLTEVEEPTKIYSLDYLDQHTGLASKASIYHYLLDLDVNPNFSGPRPYIVNGTNATSDELRNNEYYLTNNISSLKVSDKLGNPIKSYKYGWSVYPYDNSGFCDNSMKGKNDVLNHFSFTKVEEYEGDFANNNLLRKKFSRFRKQFNVTYPYFEKYYSGMTYYKKSLGSNTIDYSVETFSKGEYIGNGANSTNLYRPTQVVTYLLSDQDSYLTSLKSFEYSFVQSRFNGIPSGLDVKPELNYLIDEVKEYTWNVEDKFNTYTNGSDIDFKSPGIIATQFDILNTKKIKYDHYPYLEQNNSEIVLDNLFHTEMVAIGLKLAFIPEEINKIGSGNINLKGLPDDFWEEIFSEEGNEKGSVNQLQNLGNNPYLPLIFPKDMGICASILQYGKYVTVRDNLTEYTSAPLFYKVQSEVLYDGDFSTGEKIGGSYFENSSARIKQVGNVDKFSYNLGLPLKVYSQTNNINYEENFLTLPTNSFSASSILTTENEYSYNYYGAGLPIETLVMGQAKTNYFYYYNNKMNYRESEADVPSHNLKDFATSSGGVNSQNINDADIGPCLTADYWMPSGIIATPNHNLIFKDKIVDTYNFITRDKPIADVKFNRYPIYNDNNTPGNLNDDYTEIREDRLYNIMEYNKNGELTGSIDYNNFITTHDYDSFGRLVRSNLPYDYNSPNNQSASCDEAISNLILNGVSKSKYVWNIEKVLCKNLNVETSDPTNEWARLARETQSQGSKEILDFLKILSPTNGSENSFVDNSISNGYINCPCENPNPENRIFEFDYNGQKWNVEYNNDAFNTSNDCLGYVEEVRNQRNITKSYCTIAFRLPDNQEDLDPNDVESITFKVDFKQINMGSNNFEQELDPNSLLGGEVFLSPHENLLDYNVSYYDEGPYEFDGLFPPHDEVCLNTDNIAYGFIINHINEIGFGDPVTALNNAQEADALEIVIDDPNQIDDIICNLNKKMEVDGNFQPARANYNMHIRLPYRGVDGSIEFVIGNTSPAMIIEGKQGVQLVSGSAGGSNDTPNFRNTYTSCDFTALNKFNNYGENFTSYTKNDDIFNTSNPLANFNSNFRRSHSVTSVTIQNYLTSRINANFIASSGLINKNSNLYYDADENIEQIIGFDGSTKSFVYNTDGSIAKEEIELETSQINSTEYSIDYYDLASITEIDQNDKPDYFGLCKVETITNANGILTKNYYNLKGELKQTIQNAGASTPADKKIIKYDYNEVSELIKVTNPAGGEIKYWYNSRGLLACQEHPDMGYTVYCYDKLGNLRFSQNDYQAKYNEFHFYQYDDLNRLVVKGEERVDPGSLPSELNVPNDLTSPPITINPQTGEEEFTGDRLINFIDPNYLHDAITTNSEHLLTINESIYVDDANIGFLDSLVDYKSFEFDQWIPAAYPKANELIGSDAVPRPPILLKESRQYRATNEKPEVANFAGVPANNFEHFAWHPRGPREVNWYDRMPMQQGSIWGHMPEPLAIAAASFGTVGDFGRGRVVAKAYREHGTSPYSYMYYGYDARGRVSTKLKYTDNIGFDLVEYKYNSANLVTSMRVVDPFNQFVMWFEYSPDGRLEKAVSNVFAFGYDYSGTYPIPPPYPDYTANTDQSNIAGATFIDYLYNNNLRLYEKTRGSYIGQVAEEWIKEYFTYNQAGMVKSQIASANDGYGNMVPEFQQNINYNNAAEITGLINSYPTQTKTSNFSYVYDDFGQLDSWSEAITGETGSYGYDEVGNRQTSFETDAMTSPFSYQYFPGTNRLEEVSSLTPDEFLRDYTYDEIGRMTSRRTDYLTNNSLYLAQIRREDSQEYYYSHDNLLTTFIERGGSAPAECSVPYDPSDKTEWRYRYGPYGEREKKRMYDNFKLSDDILPQSYYLLDDANRQLAIYNGIETNSSSFTVYTGPSISTQKLNTFWYEVPMIDGTIVSWYNDDDYDNRFAMIYPAEYNLHSGNNKDISYVNEVEFALNWQKEYSITDYLGNVRMTFKETDTHFDKEQSLDYSPYGGIFWSLDNSEKQRDNWAGKEKDKENGLGDHGVRKYDHLIGRFNSIDPLWSKYLGWNPYQYSANSPVHLVDVDGKKFSYNNSPNPKEAEAYVNQAIDYLVANGAHEEAQILIEMRDTEEITIYMFIRTADDHPNKFESSRSGKLYWNPLQSLAWEDGSLSPAMMLLHEGGHAYRFWKNNDDYIIGGDTWDDQYHSLEERRVIEDYEQPAAKKLGEDARNHHNGEHIKVDNPTERASPTNSSDENSSDENSNTDEEGG